MPITDFFGSVRRITISSGSVNVSSTPARVEEVEVDAASTPTFTYADQLPIDTLLSGV